MLKGLLRLAPCAAFLFTLVSTAHAEEGGQVFTGTLGKMPIVVELNTRDANEVTGRYFYEKFHRDLALSGTLADKTLTLNEGDNRYGDDKPLPTLKLKQTANGWQGKWASPKGRTLEVQLTEAEPKAPAATALPFIAALTKSDPYEYLRVQGLTLKPGKKEMFMGYGLQWWSEPVSKVSLFSVESGYPKADLERVNQQLLGRLWSESINYYSCQLRGGKNAEFEQGAAPTFLSPDVVSLNISTRYDCGGAHPDFGDSPLNFDVHTGRVLVLADVLWIDEADTPSTTPDSDTRASHQHDVMVPWLIKQFTTLYPEEMKKPAAGDEDSCDYTDESVWSYSNWHFTATGLYLGAYFARYQRGCDSPDWSVLPYSLIKQHPGAVKLELPKG
ncbi:MULTISPECIES: hypothetical protein [unclassified Pseudomonas]|uniref:hypothetical protein n=1 Tax=unclassified Pseudomonas TaxID=196821 RepID=UPI002AC8BB16|nr:MULTISPECIES: hypothetical protein [unclassified Pseudomonas]MEB0047885.1 hypothetical protein [Pseudomonas sp. Dout3]MEB0098964.1 hypothetical protein [Pseudomonas sp. DC1.2]WPX57604.1 hypothetical protein RHM68_18565 [Pseudomonas sp. DC1.2]